MVRRLAAVSGAVSIPERVERRARWVLETLGAPHLRLGVDVPYRAEAWEAVDQGELPRGGEIGNELAAGFDFSTFGRAPAHFDPHEVELVNARLLHRLDFAAVADRLAEGATEQDWLLLRPNLVRLSDFAGWFAVLHGEIEPPELSHEERLLVKDAAGIAEKLEWGAGAWSALTGELKTATGKKGRELFHPIRLALTARESGPEMAGLVARMGKDRAVRRLEATARR